MRAAEIDGVFPERLVERVHGGEQLGPRLFLGFFKEVGRVQVRGEEPVEDDADLLRRLGEVGARAAGPEFVQRVREMDRVLRLVELQISAPVRVVAITHGKLPA